MDANATVFVIDDDAAMRDSLKDLIRSVGLRVELFASAQDFLRSEHPDVPGCIVLDVRMPEIDGLSAARAIRMAFRRYSRGRIGLFVLSGPSGREGPKVAARACPRRRPRECR